MITGLQLMKVMEANDWINIAGGGSLGRFFGS